MKYHFANDYRDIYDASQLRSLFAFETFRVQGDSVVGFVSPCHITVEKLIDRDDAVNNRPIHAESQVHYVVEMFGVDLKFGVMAQRLLNGWMERGAKLFKSPDVHCLIELSGNDVYALFPDEIQLDAGQDISAFIRSGGFHYDIPGCRKLSVSIATLSPVSALIHAGINVSTEGTPVQTASLEMLGIDPVEYTNWVGDNFARDFEKVLMACTKAKPTP